MGEEYTKPRMKTMIAIVLLGAAYAGSSPGGYGYHGKRSAAADEGTGYLRGGYERYGDEGYENVLGYHSKREAVAEAEPGRKRGNKPKCRGKREAEPGCYRGKREASADPGYISRRYGYGGYGYSGYGIGGGYYGKREAKRRRW